MPRSPEIRNARCVGARSGPRFGGGRARSGGASAARLRGPFVCASQAGPGLDPLRAIDALTKGATAEALSLLREGLADAQQGSAAGLPSRDSRARYRLGRGGGDERGVFQGLYALARARQPEAARRKGMRPLSRSAFGRGGPP